MNDDGTLTVGDGLAVCLHTGTLTRSAPANPEGKTFHLTVCERCGAWAANLYWSPVPGPVLIHRPESVSALHALAGLLAPFLPRKQDA
jgi:hypothetical protein